MPGIMREERARAVAAIRANERPSIDAEESIQAPTFGIQNDGLGLVFSMNAGEKRMMRVLSRDQAIHLAYRLLREALALQGQKV